MKRYIFCILIIAAVTSCVPLPAQFSNDIIIIKHKNYISYFSRSSHIPRYLTYILYKSNLSCSQAVHRCNVFEADPLCSVVKNYSYDYSGSGWDRGHNMPAEDNRCSLQGMTESFYFSNVVPQNHLFNTGIWKRLEMYERSCVMKFDSLIITVISTGQHLTIGSNMVVVPDSMYKVIYFPIDKVYSCYKFANSPNNFKPFELYQFSIESIEKSIKHTFLNGYLQ